MKKVKEVKEGEGSEGRFILIRKWEIVFQVKVAKKGKSKVLTHASLKPPLPFGRSSAILLYSRLGLSENSDSLN